MIMASCGRYLPVHENPAPGMPGTVIADAGHPFNVSRAAPWQSISFAARSNSVRAVFSRLGFFGNAIPEHRMLGSPAPCLTRPAAGPRS
jgi:hypothetical protein